MTETPALTARGLARQQALIAAATTLFLAKGYASVTVDEVVAIAGGSKTNIYRQFGGKEGLFAAVVDTLCAELLSPLVQLQLGDTPRAAGLMILGRTLLGQLLTPRHIAFQRMVTAASDQFPALMARWYEVGPRQSQRIIAGFLGGGPGCAAAAVLFHDMLVTEAVSRAMMGTPMPPDAVAQHLQSAVALLLPGLAEICAPLE